MTTTERHNIENYRAERARRPVHGEDVQLAIAFFVASMIGMAGMAIVMEAFK
ncbi:hypothetical protein UFOVP1672_58 [uncultured Caudovirales phage]|uniref:Uncharacterized protein n=1 Tax=uncultured Caudovirales phage TaxID=2100421 RepID=A0A6J5Q3I9_9CAUD|nr:hypothetical protein UFOVP988_80 [uncultured Caudovirales phage]CAB4211093.1 hypothetical protein UFOVP1425_80 [uncultured Caudovirales phage]CAB4223454.1 hypothetical protein UFOVP1672_58 [uncultured Caudovirales phage]